MKNYIVIFFFLSFSFSYSQSINSNWKQSLNNDLEQFKACRNIATVGVNPCSKYVGSTLSSVYKINDFYSKELGRHMVVSEIYQYLKNNRQWTLLGHAYEQEALNNAQNYANARKAAVAVYLNEEGTGHLSLILPGELSPSGSWGFKVPNSASFFLNGTENSYIDKGLSYAFERVLIKDVLIYGRNY
jgi:hypothetical protein